MNTLNGYSKSTLTDTYVLTAAGGHLAVGNAANNIPLNNSTVNTNLNADLLDGTHKSGLFTALANINNTDYPESIYATIGGTTKYLKVNYSLASRKLFSSAAKNVGGLSYYYTSGTSSTDNTGNWVGPTSSTTYMSVLRLQSHTTAGALYYRDLIFDVNSDKIWSRRVSNSGTPSLTQLVTATDVKPSGYVTSPTASLSSYWCKLWELSGVSSDNKDVTFYIHSAYNDLRGFVHLNARRNSTTTDGVTTYSWSISLRQISGNLPKDRFRLYYNNSGLILLWCNVNSRWGVYNCTIISSTVRVGNELFPYIGTLHSTSFTAALTLPTDSYVELTNIKVIADLNNTLTFSAGAFTAKTYNNSAAVTVNIPTKTSHLTNDSGYWSGTKYWANIAVSSSSSTTTAPTFASVTLGTASAAGLISMKRDSANYISCGTTDGGGGYLAIVPGGLSYSLATADLVVASNKVYPGSNNVTSLGQADSRWSNVYSILGNFTGNVTLYAASGDSPRLIFLRSELNLSSAIDWCIYDTAGDLLFLKSLGNGWETIFRIDYDTNNSTVIGNSIAAGFVKSGSSDSYVLLGGGGHKTIASFQTTYDSRYVKKAGDTMTGRLTINTTITDHSSPTLQCLVINSAAVPDGTTVSLKNSPGIGFHISSYSWGSLVFNGNFNFINNDATSFMPVKASKFVTDGGTSSLFVKGNGSLDSNTYATTSSLGNYLPLAGGTMNNGAIVKFNANGSIIQTTATTSNATALILWYKGTTKDANYSHAAQIGWHNTGDSSGAIYLVPNPQNSDPWGGSVGLYIGKTLFKWNNNAIIHAGNYTTYTVKKDGTGASGTWGISITGNAGSASLLKNNSTTTYSQTSLLFYGGTLKYSSNSTDRSINSAYGKYTSGTEDYGSIIRINYSDKYYTDFFVDANGTDLAYKRVINGSTGGWRILLDSNNSGVSGGGSSGGSSITVKINGTSKTLTIPTSLLANGGTSEYYSKGPSSTFTNTWDCNAPDRIVYSDYGSSGRSVTNAPSGWLYGTLLELGHMNYRGLNSALNMQLMWDVAHNTTNGGTLWFRGKCSSKNWAKNWCKVLSDQNSSVSGGGSSWGSSITVNIGGTSKTLTIPSNPNTDTKVTLTVTTTSNTSWRPILIGYSYSDSNPFAPSTVTNTVYATHLMKIKPDTGALWANSTITASGFVKSGSSDSYALLGGGGHKAIGNASGNIALSNGTLCTNLNSDKLDGWNRYLILGTPVSNFMLIYDTTPALFEGKLLASSGCSIVNAPDNNAPFGKVWYCTSNIAWYPGETMYFTPGETICIESWIMRPSGATGTAGVYYLGIRFKDKQGKAVNNNSGTVYMPDHSNWTCPADGTWYRRYAEYTIPKSHTAYNGSDGGGYYSGDIRLLINYSSGTVPTYYGGFRIYRKYTAPNADTVDNYHISVGSSAGSDTSTIYFVI